ncbi:NAD(P)/FAD-dependent oxidoreductase [Phreatobacter sp.]|uniref:NAD(P)/FAD-dependent oxidoreductase n=1 Tax=Phreatobacter sp. TaxID=1966341 RepID=UPI003F6FED8C
MTPATVTPLAPCPRGAGRSIAVVGSGIAGLSAAWLLSQRHNVTVFEKAAWAGGHANTVDVDTPQGRVAVDTGFICFNRPNYPNLTALFEHLGVATKATTMSFAASVRGGEIEYSSADINGLIGHRGNLIRPRFWFMLRDIVRFYAKARTLTDGAHLDGISLGQFLDREGYSRGLVEDHVLPMCAAIWSTSANEIRDYPMRSYLRFFANHGLLDIGEQQHWQTVEGGSRTYVERLKATFADRIQLGNGARAIRRTETGVTIVDEAGATHHFDDVVIGAHADEALALLDDADGEERRLLGAFRYTQNRAVLHDDVALMPRRKRVWASWNYIGGREDAGERPLCVSYWMNHLQGLDPRQPLFVTLNPIREPRAGTVKATFDYSHPLFDAAALKAQDELWSLQGRRGTWFCGSYFGYGFHEDGLQAGLAVAEQLGEVRRPWSVANESGRIVLPPVAMVAAE